MTEALGGATATNANAKRMIVVSGDSHVGPRLKEDLRPYCPGRYLETFDQFIAANVRTMDEGMNAMQGVGDAGDILMGRSTQASEVTKIRRLLNRRTAGHHDVETRIKEMDWDGVAAEVIFHGSQNTELYPFGGVREWAEPDTKKDLELVAVGHRMYNRWLADFCSVAPERLIGLAYLPMWDVDL
ncbi:MAG TPA: hypothetical protein VND62_11550, partial [Acidimicrobiales bacterium]|nr:hypothetical protein [Acidimicrobiales bacterium]